MPFDFIVHYGYPKGISRGELAMTVVKPRQVGPGKCSFYYSPVEVDFTKLEERIASQLETKNEAK